MKDSLTMSSERELLAMTSDLDQLHHDLWPGFMAAIAEMTEDARSSVARVFAIAHRDASRRNFLAGGLVTAGALGGGALLAACGGSSDTSSAAATSAPASGADLQIAKLAASLEVLAVNTYAAALKAAVSGALGAVPAAVAKFTTTAKNQHNDHQQAWNAVLTGAGQAAQTAPDPKLATTVQTALAGAKTITDLAKLALTLETVAVETYVGGASLISDQRARQTALTIAPVEAQHVAILNFVLGTYPVPDGFIKTDQARTTSDLA